MSDPAKCSDGTTVNALMVENHTGQDVNFSFIKVKRDDSGNTLYDSDKNPIITNASSPIKISPHAAGQSTTVNGWYPDYDGFTSQTVDGKLKQSAWSGDGGLVYNSGTCHNAWVVLCSDKCYYSDGSIDSNPGGSTYYMTTDGLYIAGSHLSWFKIIIMIIIVAIAIAIVAGGVYYYKKNY